MAFWERDLALGLTRGIEIPKKRTGRREETPGGGFLYHSSTTTTCQPLTHT